MAGTLNIAAKTRRIDVDNRLSLRFYYRTAANLLKQASIYRDERNVIDLYILLLRFSSLVSETVPDHRDYRTVTPREKAEFKKKLADVLSELESLKPEVQRQVDRINKAHELPPPSADEVAWADFTSQWPSAPQKTVTIDQDMSKELARIGTVDYHEPTPLNQDYGSSSSARTTPGSIDYHEPTPLTHDYWSSSSGRSSLGSVDYHEPRSLSHDYHEPRPLNHDYWASSSVRSTLDDRLSNLSLSIPRPKDETLSRHSFFRPNVPRRQNPGAPFRAQYPNYINASPIEMPSLEQSWRVPSQPYGPSIRANSVDSLAEPVLWPEADSRPFPGGYTPIIGPHLAPAPILIRQPDPPPVLAHVQTLQPLDTHTQLSTERVADPRPGLPQHVEEEKGTKHLHISTRMMKEFLALSRSNTQQNLETCAVLAGSLKKGVFYVSALIIPKQEATSDSCQTLNEEEIFDIQDKSGLFQLGWIHTHPTQTCFMSSIDLHTHYSYQIMLQEAIAIVMAPTDTEREYGIFRLSDPSGIKSIQQCQQRGFHPHEEPSDGSPIYEHCGHVFMNPNLKFDVIDLRQS